MSKNVSFSSVMVLNVGHLLNIKVVIKWFPCNLHMIVTPYL